MRRTLLTVTAAGALLAPPASAHVTPRPAGIPSGETNTVTLETPNERDRASTTRLTVTVPDGLEIDGAVAPASWTVTHDAESATWTGGRIQGLDVVDFPLDLTASGAAGSLELDVRQGYDDGAEVTWPTELTILPAGAAAPKQQLGRALVASVAGIAVVAGSLVLLRRGRRSSTD